MAALIQKLLRIHRCFSRSIAVSDLNKVSDSLRRSFCSSIEFESPHRDDPVEVTESPDLPSWVRIPTDFKIPEDDFVIPSVSCWIENYKSGEVKGYDQRTVSDKTDINAKTITKVLSNIFGSPDSVVKALNDSRVTPSESLVAQMLKRFDNNWKSAYGVFIWAESHLGSSKFSPFLYELLIDCLGKSKNFNLMWQVLEQMVLFGENYVTINTMAKVIRRLGKAGLYEEAIDVFRRIELFGVKKDLSALNILIDSLSKEKNVERANDIFIEFTNEIPPDSHTFNALIHGWCKARKLEKARTTMKEMEEHGFQPNVVTYTSLVEAYCGEKDFRKVDQLLEEMEEKGCPPNIVTYTIIMHAFGKSKEINEALKIYEKIKASGFVLDTSFYNSVIYILSKAGRLKDAREVFDEMPSQGINRDRHTYNTMITSFCNDDREEDGLMLLREMDTVGIQPDFDTYAPLLKMCCKLKRIKVLSFLLTHMSDRNVSVGLGTYSLLVRGLCKNGKLKHAMWFLEDAVMRGFVPYDTMFKLMETELEKAGLSKEKERVQELKLVQPSLV